MNDGGDSMKAQSPGGQAGPIESVVPMLHVEDVEASARFYQLLGLVRGNELRDGHGTLVWQWMGSELAGVMLSRASSQVRPEQQAALLYLYCACVEGLREHLLSCGIRDGGAFATAVHDPVLLSTVFHISYPPYMPHGELRVHDPDGYCLLIGARG